MEIEEGDKVLLNFWGENDDITDLRVFEEMLEEEGITFQTLSHMSKDYISLFNDRNEGLEQAWYKQFDDVTVVIDLMCRAPGLLPQGLAEEKIQLLAGHLKNLFAIFAKKRKLIQVTMPTKNNAKLVGMDVTQYIERIIRALDIDYVTLKEDCKKKIAEFEGHTRTIKTGKNCVLTVNTADRNWIIDAGDGALPCGEIYIAPIEEKSQGNIFFETLSLEGVAVFKNVTVTIQDGHIIYSDCDEFDAFIKDLPEGGNVVAELGIGMNHLFGGKNQCPCHYDFVAIGVVE